MWDYIKEIAKVNVIDRFKAITKVLEDNGISYILQSIPGAPILNNIIVQSKAPYKNKIVVSAHYDNAPGTPGANDNASSCLILLNLILKNKNKNTNIEYVFFAFEEYGCIGSKYYVKHNSKNINYAINLDMCGIGENIIYNYNCSENKYGKKAFEIMKKHNAIQVDKLPFSDAYSFINKNIETFYIINSTNNDVKWYKNYSKEINKNTPDFLYTLHQPNDTVDKLNYIQIKKIFLLIEDILENYNYL